MKNRLADLNYVSIVIFILKRVQEGSPCLSTLFDGNERNKEPGAGR
jgi:hypothetical protein